ncbi:fungal-specific transcription factor domain-containing protein [Dactylonectria estremocensis]|uniref:Fungal-specific transcription factor domain-containing protein n=1 Tax=Dactylonectria estremocensis TaxID=1079267 RepID=A0A9P9DVX4_9HYPO|nr:fungal-specific transcription factor domain-containing protein [Dactylonectria estremocensis]
MKQPMSRSTDGCWTCRIRHRKCDELRPICKECSDRSISCHGYGPKPGWVDDPSQLDAELTRIKRAVNENFRRNKRLRKARPATPKELPGQFAVLDLAEPAEPPRAASPDQGMPYRESHLLIHYLDYIFPLQFPFYVDNPERGGRGWLFWLLMRNGPLNQAILTLSALHHHTKFSSRSEATERELIEYHTRALQALRQTLLQYQVEGFAASNERLIDFLGCGSTLLSFEIFRGGTSGWQPHLNALSMVVDRMVSSGLQAESGQQAKEADSVENAKTFLVALILWFDLLACTSIGASPKILSYGFWLDQSGIEMGPLMGCYNWTMKAIGDIGALTGQVATEDIDVSADALNVKDRLEAGLSQIDSAREPPIPRAHAVSRVFATAALVELYTIYPDLCTTGSGVSDAVARVMESIRLLPERVSLRGLTWPICIAGSMAGEDQQSFFDTMMTRILATSGPGFSNCGTVHQVMKQCWEHRKKHPGTPWNWRDAMDDMGICALLV